MSHSGTWPFIATEMTPRLLAISDLHVAFPENRKIIENIHPGSHDDWLLLAGDVGEIIPDIEWVLTEFTGRWLVRDGLVITAIAGSDPPARIHTSARTEIPR